MSSPTIIVSSARGQYAASRGTARVRVLDEVLLLGEFGLCSDLRPVCLGTASPDDASPAASSVRTLWPARHNSSKSILPAAARIALCSALPAVQARRMALILASRRLLGARRSIQAIE